jgi:GST-like protein
MICASSSWAVRDGSPAAVNRMARVFVIPWWIARRYSRAILTLPPRLRYIARPRKPPELSMIDLYFWPTPNGRKASIMLEETGLAYRLKPVNITRGEQFEPNFLAISPNNKIPAIVDDDGPGGEPLTLFESGAILEYLAKKSGVLMPASERKQWITKQWLMFQMGNIGPLWGQHGHFIFYAREKVPYAIERYRKEVLRLLDVMNMRLGKAAYLAGADYSMADVATYPWVVTYDRRSIDINEYPHVARWLDAVGARPAVQSGMALMDENDRSGDPDKEHLEAYFGDQQYQRRS